MNCSRLRLDSSVVYWPRACGGMFASSSASFSWKSDSVMRRSPTSAQHGARRRLRTGLTRRLVQRRGRLERKLRLKHSARALEARHDARIDGGSIRMVRIERTQLDEPQQRPVVVVRVCHERIGHGEQHSRALLVADAGQFQVLVVLDSSLGVETPVEQLGRELLLFLGVYALPTARQSDECREQNEDDCTLHDCHPFIQGARSCTAHRGPPPYIRFARDEKNRTSGST